MIVYDQIELAMGLPPRTGSTWILNTMRFLNIPWRNIGRGRHWVEECDRREIPGNYRRLTVVRHPEPWLRSIYKTFYAVCRHDDLPYMRKLLAIEADEQEQFIEAGGQYVAEAWAYYQPSEFVLHTETLADDLIKALECCGLDVPCSAIRRRPPEFFVQDFRRSWTSKLARMRR